MNVIRKLFKNALIRNRGFFLTNIIVGLVGLLIVFVSLLFNSNKDCKTIILSIGTSIIAASIVSFLDMLRGEQVRESEDRVNDIVITGGIDNIFKRRDLDEYNELVNRAKKSIDITGYSLRGFYESNKDFILRKCNKNKSFKVRIILVNPDSQFSINRDVEENEAGSRLFIETYNNLLKWSSKSENIQIRLIDAPLSDMLYRIDDVMYTGPYFYRTSSKETYTNKLKSTGWLFKAYQENFDRMWEDARSIE